MKLTIEIKEIATKLADVCLHVRGSSLGSADGHQNRQIWRPETARGAMLRVWLVRLFGARSAAIVPPIYTMPGLSTQCVAYPYKPRLIHTGRETRMTQQRNNCAADIFRELKQYAK